MPPKPIIDKSNSYIVIDGDIKKPGRYYVKRGTIVTFRMQVKNVGDEGTCYAWLYDFANRKALYEKMFHAVKGGLYTFNGYFTVESNMLLKMQTWYWDWNQKKWIFVDEWG